MKRKEVKLGEVSLERLYKALANRRRLSILRYLKKHDEKSVSSIADVIGITVKSTSKHLVVLKNAYLVEERKRGVFVWYRINKNLKHIAKYNIDYI